jgi:hypothetical protein
MNSNKLVEAFVMKNSTPLMQMEAFSKNPNDTEKLVVELSEQVFCLPNNNRTFCQLEKDLKQLFFKELGWLGVVKSIFLGLTDKNGPFEGVQKSVIINACLKMGYLNPLHD